MTNNWEAQQRQQILYSFPHFLVKKKKFARCSFFKNEIVLALMLVNILPLIALIYHCKTNWAYFLASVLLNCPQFSSTFHILRLTRFLSNPLAMRNLFRDVSSREKILVQRRFTILAEYSECAFFQCLLKLILPLRSRSIDRRCF